MKVVFDERGACTRALLVGTIDGDADFAGLTQQYCLDLRLDLSAVTMITSAGVVRWLRFVRSLVEGLAVKLAGCPVSFVNQLGMIPGFLGPAVMETIFVPYLCPSCGHAENVLTRTADLPPAAATSMRCPSCGQAMELDVVEEQYFSFLHY